MIHHARLPGCSMALSTVWLSQCTDTHPVICAMYRQYILMATASHKLEVDSFNSAHRCLHHRIKHIRLRVGYALSKWFSFLPQFSSLLSSALSHNYCTCML